MADKRDVKEKKNYGKNLVDNKDVRERVSNYALKNIQRIVNGRGYLESKWIMLERLWRGDPISRFYPGRNTTHVPEPFKAVESLVPRILDALMPTENWFRALKLDDASKMEAEAIEILLHDQLEDGDFRQRLEQFIRIMCIQGFAAAKVPYVQDTEEYFYREREEKEVYEDGLLIGTKPGAWKQKTYYSDKSRTELLPLEIFDFIADPRFDNPLHRKSPGCGDRTRQNKEYVHKMLDEKVYSNITHEEIDKLGNQRPRIVTGLGEDLRYWAIDNAMMPRRGEDSIVITEWWGYTPVQNDGSRTETVVTFLNEEKCVRIQENKLWHQRRPYVYNQYTPEKGKLYGMGVIEPIIWLVQDLNDMRNTVNHSAAIIANPMLKVEDSANVEEEMLVATPGKILRTSNNRGVEPLHIPDMTAVARMSEAQTKQDIVETTGTTRLYYGTAEGGTATEALTRTREANERVKSVVKSTSKLVTKRFLEMAHSNNHQWLEEDRLVVLTGEMAGAEHYSVTPDKLAGPAKFEIKVAPQIELLGIRGQQMMQFMERVQANPNLSMSANWTRLMRVIWSDLFGNREIDYVFPPDETYEPVSQEDENRFLFKGVDVDVKPWHNHMEHLRLLEQVMLMPEFLDLSDEAQSSINAHATNHERWLERLEDQASNPQLAAPEAPAPSGTPANPNFPLAQNAAGVGQQLAAEARAGTQGG